MTAKFLRLLQLQVRVILMVHLYDLKSYYPNMAIFKEGKALARVISMSCTQCYFMDERGTSSLELYLKYDINLSVPETSSFTREKCCVLDV